MKNTGKCLLLLTGSFPYSDGEPFLECEMSKHNDNFDKIIILAQETDADAKQTRAVNPSVDVHNIARHSKKAGRAGDLLKGILRTPSGSPAYEADRDAVGKSIKKRVFVNYFGARAERQLEESMDILRQYDFTVFDEVVIYSYWFFVPAYVGLKIKEYFTANGINSVLVSRAHGYDVYENINSLGYLPCRRYLLSGVDRLLVCSQYGRDFIAEKYPGFSDKIFTSRLGTADCGEGTWDGVFRIVTCSRVVPLKRLDRLVDALAVLEGKQLPVKTEWTHIGGGKLLDELKEYAGKKLSRTSVVFTGSLTNQEVYNYYRSHPFSVFVNVSSSEGLPVSVMEAISFGIPALTTNVGGTGEVVINEVSGKLIDKDFTDEQLAEELSAFATLSPENYGRLRESAREFWKSNYDADANYAVFSRQISDITVLPVSK